MISSSIQIAHPWGRKQFGHPARNSQSCGQLSRQVGFARTHGLEPDQHITDTPLRNHDHPVGITDDDVAVLRELGVRSAFDFRGTEERAAALCGMPEISVHSLPVEPTVVAALRAIAAGGTPLSTDHAVEVMRGSRIENCSAAAASGTS